MVCEDLLMALNTVKKAGFISCAVYEKTNKEENAKKQLADFYIEDFNDFSESREEYNTVS